MKLSEKQQLVLCGLLADQEDRKALAAAYGKSHERGTTRFGRQQTINSLVRAGLVLFLYAPSMLEKFPTLKVSGLALRCNGTWVEAIGPCHVHTTAGRDALLKLGVFTG